MIYMTKVRRGVEEVFCKEVLLSKIVPNEVTCRYHGHTGEKQLYRRCHWYDVISHKCSERICGHYHENGWNKDRNFSQPIHARVTPENASYETTTKWHCFSVQTGRFGGQRWC